MREAEKERSPSPMRRMLSVGEKGIVALECCACLCGLAVDFGFAVFETVGLDGGFGAFDCSFGCFLWEEVIPTFCLLFLPIFCDLAKRSPTMKLDLFMELWSEL